MGEQSTRPPAEELLGSFFSGKTRWVFPAIFLFFSLFLLLAGMIRYADVISLRVVIRPEQGLHRYYAAVPARIGELVAGNEQAVDSGAVLLAWEHDGRWRDVLALSALDIPKEEEEIRQVETLRLGALESDWVLARSAWDSWRQAEQTARAKALAAPVGRQISQLALMEEALRRQAESLGREADLAETTLGRYRRLAQEKTTSEEALARAEMEYLEKKAAAESVELEIRRVFIQREALEKELLEKKLADDETLREKEVQWKTSWSLLQARQQEWVQRHLLKADQPGRVIFNRPLHAGQWVDEGEPLLAVQQENGGAAWIARGWIPASGSGRAEAGSEVSLRLDAFPYEEYGALPGRLVRISPLSENDSYLVEIEIADSLITDTGRKLAGRAEMPATARILTPKKSLLRRVWEGIKRL